LLLYQQCPYRIMRWAPIENNHKFNIEILKKGGTNAERNRIHHSSHRDNIICSDVTDLGKKASEPKSLRSKQMKKEVKRILWRHVGGMFLVEITLFIVILMTFFLIPNVKPQSNESKLASTVFWNMLMNMLLFTVLLAAEKDEYLKKNATKICNREYIITRAMPLFFGFLPFLFIAHRSTWFYQAAVVLCCLSAAVIIVLSISIRKLYKSLT
jgi:hypothetical protein